MFGRNLLHTRIRAAETALADGRIDEAFAIAADATVQAERRGQQLADAVARPVLARARLAVQRGDGPAALDDLNRLAQLGRESADARELRQRVLSELRGKYENAADQQAVLDRAAANLREGRLESGRIDIQRVVDGRERARLEAELDLRVQRVADAMESVEDALQRDDVLSAARNWCIATKRHGHNGQSDRLAGLVAGRLQVACEGWFGAGRLDQMLAAEDVLRALANHAPALETQARLVALCREAARELGSAQFEELRRSLLRMQAAASGIRWLPALLDSLLEIQKRQESLWASPLGVIAAVASGDDRTLPIPEGALIQDSAPQPRRQAERRGAGNAEGMLVLIDGGGSSLWLRQDRVRIGRAGSSSARVEIPIPGDLEAHHADVVRSGDDYFLVAHGPVEVNQQRVQRVLLRDGDRLRLGANVKLSFQKPSARSGSAVLSLHHRCRLPHDVSSVVLFHETALIGPVATCHVRTREGSNQAVVFEQNGGYLVREAPIGQRGKLGDAKPLCLDQTLSVGDLRMTAKAYPGVGPGEPA